jgi:urease accessory protein
MLKKVFITASIMKISLFAHTGIGHSFGFLSGFFHPIGGADHILAMFAVGLWAAQMGSRALWTVPLSFIVMMLAGAALGLNGVDIPFIESGILASILVLGMMIGLGIKMPLLFSSAVVGFFAVFHGSAHGLEMPLDVGGFEYALGFILATAMLHAAGMSLGLFMHKISKSKISRFTGGTIAAAGIVLSVA